MPLNQHKKHKWIAQKRNLLRNDNRFSDKCLLTLGHLNRRYGNDAVLGLVSCVNMHKEIQRLLISGRDRINTAGKTSSYAGHSLKINVSGH
jgi:hypothetical protein